MRSLFHQVDGLGEGFLHEYETNPSLTLKAVSWQDHELEVSVLWLFTHTMTHEFHHKGQILSMVRHLGCEPIDTDVVLYFL
ncbi:hypothetical protein GCM10010954_16540 [Halobacillus andaensis]|uniref:DinB family protein n=1 Tax=Halobacillus andaensis TaxID=1176239 RepID=A0A917EWZ5_HALAA|nr:putative damage-inducible protein DinB [Halobacillus andaensis]GGF18473.1 hypothetical protein GCM10010954_16540 [Halobacillus andaensis]